MVTVTLMKNAVALRHSKTSQGNPYAESGSIRIEPVIGYSMPINLYVSHPIESRILESERQFVDALAENL